MGQLTALNMTFLLQCPQSKWITVIRPKIQKADSNINTLSAVNEGI